MAIRNLFVLSLIVFCSACIHGGKNSGKTCDTYPDLQGKRSQELQALAQEDQDDRKKFSENNATESPKLYQRDAKRRQRVGQIFAEGCIRSKEDFAAASLVFQHGTVPEHFFLSYHFAKNAVDMGDKSQKVAVANSVDRYYITSGYRQIFATQASRDEKGCWCLERVEESFPEEARSHYASRSLKGAQMWAKSLNAGPNECKPKNYCATKLKYPPRGIFPGIW